MFTTTTVATCPARAILKIVCNFVACQQTIFVLIRTSKHPSQSFRRFLFGQFSIIVGIEVHHSINHALNIPASRSILTFRRLSVGCRGGDKNHSECGQREIFHCGSLL
jgi:hypothetical protein